LNRERRIRQGGADRPEENRIEEGNVGAEMGTIRVLVGRVIGGSGGIVQDDTRTAEFEGVELACRTEYGLRKDGVSITDSRGTDETLYRTHDGFLVVTVKAWSHWEGEPTEHSLYTVSMTDLLVGGRFEALGFKAGYGRSLTLEEAAQDLGMETAL